MTALQLDLPSGVSFVPGTDGSRSSIGRSYITLICHVDRRPTDTVEQTIERARDALGIMVGSYLIEGTAMDYPDVVEWRVEPAAYVSEDQQRVTARCRLGVVKWRAHKAKPLPDGIITSETWEIGPEDSDQSAAISEMSDFAGEPCLVATELPSTPVWHRPTNRPAEPAVLDELVWETLALIRPLTAKKLHEVTVMADKAIELGWFMAADRVVKP